MSFNLRPYQQKLIDKTIESLKAGHRKPLLVLPTGGGKTAIAATLVSRSANKNVRSLFVCHREELLKQTIATYAKVGLTAGIIKSGYEPDYSNPLQIASVQTLVNRLEKIHPKLVFFDEAHHVAAGQWAKVAAAYPDAIFIGLTATPCRLDGKPLNMAFDDMIEVINTAQLIEQGYLSQYEYYAPSIIDDSKLVMGSNGDYTRDSLDNFQEADKIIGDNVETYLKLCNGKRNIVFACNRKHGRAIGRRYEEAGVAVKFLDGETPTKERNDAVEAFKNGDIKVLVNCELFGEGFDLPAVEVVSLLRPTASTSLYLQQVGRGLRTFEGKDKAIILDHANNYMRHGMPDDIREWSLWGGLKKKRNQEESKVKIQRCPNCYAVHKPSLTCPFCGYVHKADGKVIKEVAGELVLINSEKHLILNKEEIKMANTLADLIAIEKDRNFKKYWAENMWRAKTGENLWDSYEGLLRIAEARGYSKGWAWVRKGLKHG